MPKSQEYIDSWNRSRRVGEYDPDFDFLKEQEAFAYPEVGSEEGPAAIGGMPDVSPTGDVGGGNTLRDYIERMRAEGKTPTFTNIEGSSAFSDMPEEDVYTEPEYREGPMGQMTDLRPKPPEGAVPTVFDREKFLESAMQQVGNPNEFNTEKELQKQMITQEPDAFERLFGYNVSWEDRDKIGDEANRRWQAEQLKLRARKRAELKEQKINMVNRLNQMMQMFDAKAEHTRRMREAERTRTKEVLTAMTEAEEKKQKQLDDDLGKRSELIQERDAIKLDVLDRGEEVPNDVKAIAASSVKAIEDQIARIEKRIAKNQPKQKEKEGSKVLDRESVKPFIKQARDKFTKDGRSKEWIAANKETVTAFARKLAKQAGYK